MEIAILSDIHGNCFALKSVLDAVKKKGIETLLITGDFVGYYFWPVEVFNLLEGYNFIAIRGNHDRMLEKAKVDKACRVKICQKYGSGLNIALEQLSKERIEWLICLPDSLEYETPDGNILLCHGSPWDGDEYVYPDSNNESLSRYNGFGVSWIIQGHTHYPMCKKVDNVVIINPGSVGQPRNKQPGAQWAMLDTSFNEVEFFCEQYDIEHVVQESKTRHPEIPYLANILQRV
jgi:putative phosphoesterase